MSGISYVATSTAPLYAKRFRTTVQVFLYIIVVWNLTMFGLGCYATGGYSRKWEYGGAYFGGVIGFMIWALIPLVYSVLSIVEAVRLFQENLSPLHIVVSGSTGVVAFGLCFFSWSTTTGAAASLWFTLPSIALYLAYMILGCVAFHRERKARRAFTKAKGAVGWVQSDSTRALNNARGSPSATSFVMGNIESGAVELEPTNKS